MAAGQRLPRRAAPKRRDKFHGEWNYTILPQPGI